MNLQLLRVEFFLTQISVAYASTVSSPLHIYGITVDFSKPEMNVRSAEVRMGKLHLRIERKAGNSWQQTFSIPM
ncbi:uncharacterized protein BJ212DRAFT_1385095 [Suillus subaureus]|uniref:Uncharacterized protein n=1 Tax=Suillus subaureus TaxID=48587 RepID=A0A9P7E124_9AGAM|nr:uncharacterized protein BJ212DRAFT_1385095 [Suillus subaureus]KAG1808031.1 hypothetical protein BJ212DRAFT_1385095 [Suillus subaureus]